MDARKRHAEGELSSEKLFLLDPVAEIVDILAPVPVPDEVTVTAALKKLMPKTTIAALKSDQNDFESDINGDHGLSNNSGYFLLLIMSKSEAQYLVSDDQVEKYTTAFGVTNVVVSDIPSGVLETLVHVNAQSINLVVQCALLMSFIATAKLNNFVGARKFTLKLSNYILNFLHWPDNSAFQLRDFGHRSRLRAFDYSKAYLAGSGASSVRIRGDFYAMFDFLYQLVKTQVGTPKLILQLPITGVYGIPTLMQRQAVNQDIEV